MDESFYILQRRLHGNDCRKNEGKSTDGEIGFNYCVNCCYIGNSDFVCWEEEACNQLQEKGIKKEIVICNVEWICLKHSEPKITKSLPNILIACTSHSIPWFCNTYLIWHWHSIFWFFTLGPVLIFIIYSQMTDKSDNLEKYLRNKVYFHQSSM